MAQICEHCGNKIGRFSTLPLELPNGKVLCANCAKPVQDKIDTLRYKKNKLEFDLLKTDIIEKCRELYDDSITGEINQLIDLTYCGSRAQSGTELDAKTRFLTEYMLTTGYDFCGYTIKKYCGVISGQVVLGTGFLSEFSASFADFFGSECGHFADKLEAAKCAAIEKLIIKSTEKGANAVIGVDFDYITFHSNMIGVIANGTSVLVEKCKSAEP